jgi:hypothetical protein
MFPVLFYIDGDIDFNKIYSHLKKKTELKQSPMDPLHSLTCYAHKDPYSYYLLFTTVNQF